MYLCGRQLFYLHTPLAHTCACAHRCTRTACRQTCPSCTLTCVCTCVRVHKQTLVGTRACAHTHTRVNTRTCAPKLFSFRCRVSPLPSGAGPCTCRWGPLSRRRRRAEACSMRICFCTCLLLWGTTFLVRVHPIKHNAVLYTPSTCS